MPKLKTHKGLRCRVRVTRNGKVVRRKAGASHLMSHKSGKRRRQLRKQSNVKGAYARTARDQLGEG